MPLDHLCETSLPGPAAGDAEIGRGAAAATPSSVQRVVDAAFAWLTVAGGYGDLNRKV